MDFPFLTGNRPVKEKLLYTGYRSINRLYSLNFPLYKRLYFGYKKISDGPKILMLNKWITSGMTVVDVGANIGFYSHLLSALVGSSGRVHSFEPDPSNYRHLRENEFPYDNVSLNQTALGSTSKKIKLFLSEDINVDHQAYQGPEHRRHVVVSQTTLDEYLGQRTNVDFIKIDVQGYDYFALLGMKQTIKHSKKIIVMGELWPYGLTKSGSSVREYLKLIKSLGLELNGFLLDKPDVMDQFKDDKTYTCDFFATKP